MEAAAIIELITALAPLGEKIVSGTLTWIASLKDNKKVTIDELLALAKKYDENYDARRAEAGVPVIA